VSERLERCETCRWWDREDSMVGICHRRAPLPWHDFDDAPPASWWPTTNENDWCGEWTPADSAANLFPEDRAKWEEFCRENEWARRKLDEMKESDRC